MLMWLGPGILVALGSSFVEIKVLQRVSALANAYKNGFLGIPGVVINFACSFTLSYIMGSAFAATGLIAFMGGLFSTVLTKIWIDGQTQLNNHGVTWQGTKEKILRPMNEAGEWYSANRQLFADVWRTIKVILLIVVAPVKAALWANSKGHQSKDRIIELRQSIRTKLSH